MSPAPSTTERTASGALLADATRLGGVELTVTSLDRSLDYYTQVIGLAVHTRDERRAALGAGGEDLVTLHEDAGAAPPGRRAGLYHYALLLPTRLELARVGRRIADSRTAIDGASDHGTHEAIYLPDPDGIGIELAADRPREEWPDRHGASIFGRGPDPLDIPGLFATISGEDRVERADGEIRMGHIHLHVGELDAQRRFYRDGLGFAVTAEMPTATFLSAGGYHHHVAYNLWRGIGVAPAPSEGVVGLRHWTLVTADESERDAVTVRLGALDGPVERRADGSLFARDPAGVAVLVR